MAENQIQVITQQAAEVTKNVASIKTDIVNAITDNNSSLQACINAGENLLALSESMNDELDAQIASYIKKASATKKAMTERRKGVTQVFDMVKSGFTKMEAFLDSKSEESIVYKLQKKRDEYAAYKLELQRKAEEERKRLARIEAAKTQLHDDVISVCNQIVNDKTSEALDKLTEKFRLMTLDNAEIVKKEINDFSTEIKIGTFLAERKPSVPQEVDPEEARQIMNAAYKEVNDSLTKSYSESVASAKQDILDTFDSKIAELQEQKRLEEERKRKEEEARKAEEERKRKEEELKKAKDEEERKKREAELKAAEEERLRKEAEAKAAEEERKKREAELKAAEEAAEAERQKKAEEERKAREEEERIRKAQSQTQSLFDQTSSVSAPVKAKVTHHIEIDAPEGFLAIMQMWWTHEGSKMSLEDLTKKLGFMTKVCEKLKNKEDISVIDQNVRYVEDIVAK